MLSSEIDASWLVYKTRHIDRSGRVKDNGNGGISHSEGQGYAMVLAATIGDRKAFDKIWAWTKTELMAGGQAFAAWKWDPKAVPHITDPNNATDGDLLIAWGLRSPPTAGARRPSRPRPSVWRGRSTPC